MAFTSSTQWTVTVPGSDTQGGAFDPGVTGFATDGAATSATGSSPVFTSASYSFVAGDVNAWLYIKSGTNWTPGWYQIASVASGAATLSAAAGNAVLADNSRSTVAGCATTASPTGATWGIDYSQGDSARISFTDLVIGGTNTTFTSAANPVGVNFIGNVLSVNSGTGFTVQRVAIVSTSGTVATCDKALGTASSTGGTGNLGGALATLDTAYAATPSPATDVNPNIIHLKDGTYSRTSTLTFSHNAQVVGYGTSHNDRGTKPLITSSTNSVDLIGVSNCAVMFSNVSFSHTATTRGKLIKGTATGAMVICENCVLDGGSYGIVVDNSVASAGGVQLFNTEVKNCTTAGIITWWVLQVTDSYIHDNSGPGLQKVSNQNDQLFVYGSVIANNTIGIYANGYDPGAGGASGPFGIGLWVLRSAVYNNSSDGVKFVGNHISGGSAPIHFEDSIIYGNGGFGVNANLLYNPASISNKNNAWGSNTSGDVHNWTTGLNPITLTANPFTSPGTGDYSLDSTAGGGALLKAAGFSGMGNLNLDVGPLQSSGTTISAPQNYGFIG